MSQNTVTLRRPVEISQSTRIPFSFSARRARFRRRRKTLGQFADRGGVTRDVARQTVTAARTAGGATVTRAIHADAPCATSPPFSPNACPRGKKNPIPVRATVSIFRFRPFLALSNPRRCHLSAHEPGCGDRRRGHLRLRRRGLGFEQRFAFPPGRRTHAVKARETRKPASYCHCYIRDVYFIRNNNNNDNL